jgi:hypothetical protein
VEIQHFFAGVPVADLAASLVWYEQFFGRPPDMLPNDDEAVWHVTESTSIYVVRDAGRAGNGLLTLIVRRLSKATGGLASRGIQAGVEQRGPEGRRSSVVDPEGNRITFAELSPGPG